MTHYTTLHNGIQLPWISLGTHTLHDKETSAPLIQHALKNGYHSIDTASIYKNESLIANVLHNKPIKREEVFLTAKVALRDQGYTSTLAAFRTSLIQLNVDYVDLYLIHGIRKKTYKDTWRALEKLYRDGFVRAIGVSHFDIHHLEQLMNCSTITPMVNQIELHPRNTQQPLHTFCQNHHIQLQASSPLMQGELLFSHPLIQQLSTLYNKTPAQIILRWHFQQQIAIVLSTKDTLHLNENMQIFDFELSLDELIAINALNSDYYVTTNPMKSRPYWMLYLYQYAQKLKQHLQK
jgi:methylglyoxal/glyoxal reductase